MQIINIYPKKKKKNRSASHACSDASILFVAQLVKISLPPTIIIIIIIIIYLFIYLFGNGSCEFFFKEQSLATKFVITLGYNLIQYLFIGGEFYKSTIRLHLLLISSMLANFLEN